MRRFIQILTCVVVMSMTQPVLRASEAVGADVQVLVDEGIVAQVTIPLTNPTAEPAELSALDGGCSCLSTSVPTGMVRPGGSIEVPATIDVRRRRRDFTLIMRSSWLTGEGRLVDSLQRVTMRVRGWLVQEVPLPSVLRATPGSAVSCQVILRGTTPLDKLLIDGHDPAGWASLGETVMTMRALKVFGLDSKSSASIEPPTPHVKPHGPLCSAISKCSTTESVATRHLDISALMPLKPSMPTSHEQAGIMLHPAAALRNDHNTLPNLAVGQRELPSSLASDQRLAPAPSGFLLLTGTPSEYPNFRFIQ